MTIKHLKVRDKPSTWTAVTTEAQDSLPHM